jgi:hypothetical protein
VDAVGTITTLSEKWTVTARRRGGATMTKPEAITEAIKKLDETGGTQFVLRRGDNYKVFPASEPTPNNWKTAEMISRGNVHAYRPRP